MRQRSLLPAPRCRRAIHSDVCPSDRDTDTAGRLGSPRFTQSRHGGQRAAPTTLTPTPTRTATATATPTLTATPGGATSTATAPPVPIRPGDVVIINEILQNPEAVADTAGEWFEVYNATVRPST